MSVLSAIFLGLLQGITEFFPVSSSGHLVLAQSIIPEFSQPGVFFDTVLHAGTLLAIVGYFRKEIVDMSKKYLSAIVLATIPAVVVGYFFQSQLESLFNSTAVVGFALLITAVFNLFTDKQKSTNVKMSSRTAIFVGTAQALAIIPGISRSGSTIFAGVSAGMNRKSAAKFSFLLSIPAVLGANILQFTQYGFDQDLGISILLAGFMAAFVSGWFAINAVLRILTKHGFKGFAVYTAILGVLTIVLL